MTSTTNTRLILAGLCALTAACESDRPVPSPPEITTTSPLPNGQVGQPYSAAFKASGGNRPLTWSSSTTPANLKLEPSSGSLAGVPNQSGSFRFEVTVADSGSPAGSDTKVYDLRINPEAPLAILTEVSLPKAPVKQAYRTSLQAIGGQGRLHWSSSSLADDFALDPSTGAITGTPERIGRFTFDVRVTDAARRCASKRFVLEVSETTAAAPLP